MSVEGPGLDSYIPSSIQGFLAVGAVIAGMVAYTWRELKKAPSALPELVVSRADFMEKFTTETAANREVLKESRELLVKIVAATEKAATFNDEILRILRRQSEDARFRELSRLERRGEEN